MNQNKLNQRYGTIKLIVLSMLITLLSGCALMDELKNPSKYRSSSEVYSNEKSVSELCNSGDSDKCLELMNQSRKIGNLKAMYTYASTACSHGNKVGCEEMTKQDELEKKLKTKCDKKKHAESCAHFAQQRGMRGEEHEARFYVALSCRYGNERACVFIDQIKEDERRKAQKEAEDRENYLIQRQIANEEQQRRTDAVNAFGNAVNNWNAQQQPVRQPSQQKKCRTVVRPGNGMDGAAAYMDTVCD